MSWYSREHYEKYEEMEREWMEAHHGVAPSGTFVIEGELTRVSEDYIEIDGYRIEVSPPLWLDPKRSRHVSGPISLEYHVTMHWREESWVADHDDVVEALGDRYVKNPGLMRLEADPSYQDLQRRAAKQRARGRR